MEVLFPKCIYDKISDEDLECCPVCNIDLGCVPLEKLRLDHSKLNLRYIVFPSKRREVKEPEVVAASVPFPAKRKERSLSSLVVNTPRVSAQSTMTGRRTEPTRKASSPRSSSFSIEKSIQQEEELLDNHPESSSSPETSNELHQNNGQSEGSQSTPNKEAENGAKSWDTQRSDAKPEHVKVNESDSLVQKTKNKENKRKAEVEDEESSPFPVCSDTAKSNKLRRVRREKEPFGESGISSVSTVGQEKQLNTQASIEQLSQQYLEVTTNEPNALAELERHFTGEFSEETPSEQAIPSTIISDINQLEAIPLNNTSQPKNTQPETIPSNTLQSEINQPETIHSEAIPSTTIPTYTIVQPNSEPHPTTVGSKPKEASTPTQGKIPVTKRRKFTVHNLEEASEKKDSGSSVAKISSICSDNQPSSSKNLSDTILSQALSSTLKDIEHMLRTFKDKIRKLCLSMFDALKKAARLEAERLERERIEKERLEAERIERERIEAERLEALKKEQERLEEEARIAAEKPKIEELLKQAPEVALKLIEDVKYQKEEQNALKEQAQAIQTSMDENQKRNDEMVQAIQTSMDENQKRNDEMFTKLFTILNDRLPPPT
ncbi:E3 ubiquitin protein ligase DRIP2 [Trifolium repens]|nr:E3 ubiquitin protein ligase DRIP2 [Trifolium repens]